MDISIIRSRRKTIAIQLKPDLSIVVRAPIGISDEEIHILLKKKSSWLHKHISSLQARQEKAYEPLSPAELQELKNKAREIIPQRVDYYARKIGVDYGRITIRQQKSRWGSCSSRGNLNFNCLLMLMPPKIIDYVVVHELCHLKEMNHSKAFWQEVAHILPDYREAYQWLKKEGEKIIYPYKN